MFSLPLLRATLLPSPLLSNHAVTETFSSPPYNHPHGHLLFVSFLLLFSSNYDFSSTLPKPFP
jgi:hypothetical protein